MSRFFAQHFAALRDALRRLVAAPLNTLLSLVVHAKSEIGVLKRQF